MRRAAGLLFLALVASGVFWPVAVAFASDCCDKPSTGCGTMPGTFSLCCFNAHSPLPTWTRTGFALMPASFVEVFSEAVFLPPDPLGILHVPRPIPT
ncbi:MAG TPA: hypothetical protein VN493_19020 [Thermoanaerobaculia bacterium]|nr:hypothetical protein [Thermoanaerobaculia bacterium]